MSLSVGLLAQYVVIALAVLLSAAYVTKRQFPGTIRRARIALAVPLVRQGRPAWMQAFGRFIAPPSSGGGDSCGSCNGCDTPSKR